MYLSAHSLFPISTRIAFPRCKTAQLDMTPQKRWMNHQLIFLPKCLEADLMLLSLTDHFFTQASGWHPSHQKQTGTGERNRTCSQQAAIAPAASKSNCHQASKFSKTTSWFTQTCWGGDWHREWDHSRAQHILPRNLGDFKMKLSQCCKQGYYLAHWGKRWGTQKSCALTDPSAGDISTTPCTVCKFNLQTHF